MVNREWHFHATVVPTLPAPDNFKILYPVESFDYSWVPHPMDPPYIYHFPSQHQSASGVTYTVPGATDYKLVDACVARVLPDATRFNIVIPVADFDYSWHPNPLDPPYIYVFGNQWYPAEKMPTVEYHVAGATERKFLSEPRAILPERHDSHWYTPVDCVWDYSWRPDPDESPYIYVFGNQWYPGEVMPTVEYHVPGATDRKFMSEPVALLLADTTCWSVPEEITADNIDFSWVPHPGDDPYIHHFGSEYQISTGLTYTVPGATVPKFAGEPPKIVINQQVISVLDIFFIDKNNATAQTRYELLTQRYPGIHKIRYANSMMETVQRCVARSTTNKFWVISSEYDYSQFDFAWHAEPWQSYMTHVFPSQHQKWSDTFLINRQEFTRHSAWAQSMEQFPNLNFVTNQMAVKPDNLNMIYYVDHGNDVSRHQYEYLRLTHPDMVFTRLANDYLSTFRRIMATAETESIWIINSICSYSRFDFTWQPEPWQAEMIHVFASGSNTRGDTFYIPVDSFRTQMVELDILDFFNVINYCEDQAVTRFDMPVHQYTGDNLITEIKNYKFTTPYVYFTQDRQVYRNTSEYSLWNLKDRAVTRYSASGKDAVVPREIQGHIKTQIYDYPYIDNKSRGTPDRPLDIIFLSNGEPDAERWHDHVERVSKRSVEWLQGVTGRTLAYQTAAQVSSTPWFFMVFAKLEVAQDFDWCWQPDYFQEPKHYIFNSLNPVNGLEYGHQGMIAYNKRLVLENNTPGIDFTLTQAHESVPISSGTAHFNSSPWQAWRTAFREVVKLQYYQTTTPTVETQHRLDIWCNVGQGKNAEWCLRGAQDAVHYFTSVGGDYEKLLLTFDWDWLADYASLYNWSQPLPPAQLLNL